MSLDAGDGESQTDKGLIDERSQSWIPVNTDAQTRRMACYHEAGHCVAHLTSNRPFQFVKIYAHENGGHVSFNNPPRLQELLSIYGTAMFPLAVASQPGLFETRDEVIPSLVNLICGSEAARRYLSPSDAPLEYFLKQHTPGGHSDQEKFAKLRWAFVGLLENRGFAERFGPYPSWPPGHRRSREGLILSEQLNESEKERFRAYFYGLPEGEQAAWSQLADKASRLIDSNWDLVTKIADRLFETWDDQDGATMTWEEALAIQQGMS